MTTQQDNAVEDGQGISVSVIGLGSMGLPMAQCLTKAYEVHGFDPSPERQALAREYGIILGATPADAADGSSVVLFAVRDRKQLESGLFGENGAAEVLKPGTLVIFTSTIGPDAAIDVGKALAEKGVDVVDAPISGGPRRAGLGDLAIFAGGAAEAMAKAEPILELLSSTLTTVGPRVGDGQLMKVINQLLAGVHIAAAAEALALARGVGLDPEVVLNSLVSGAAGSFMFGDRGPRMIESLTTDPEVKSRVDIFVKDMGLVAEIAASSHIQTPQATAAQKLYLEAESQGLGAHDDSTVIKLLLADD